MTSTPERSPLPIATDCWNAIGIAGDRSCPELVEHIHCRNCPVYASAALGFFDRPAPSGYLSDWAEFLSEPLTASDSKDVSLLIFRLGGEWLALRTRVVIEVTSTRSAHHIPHRSNDILIGMVNLRGQLQLQVSMHGLLGIAADVDNLGTTRLIVVKSEGQTWVFEADEVRGVHRFAQSKLGAVPSTLSNPATSFSQAVIAWRERSVGFLDDARVFASLKGRFA